jgi:hypothetical protein
LSKQYHIRWRKCQKYFYVTLTKKLLTLLTSLSLYIFTIWKCIAYNFFCRDGIYFELSLCKIVRSSVILLLPLFGIFWPLCCLFFDIQILITPLVSFGHCVVCSLIYRFWLPLWFFWPSKDTKGVIRICISKNRQHNGQKNQRGNQNLYIKEQTTQWPKEPEALKSLYPSGSFGHCVVCSLIYRFWLPLWYLLAIVLSLIYRFWLPLWYLLAIVLSVLWYADSDYPFGIFWPLCCLWYTDSDYPFGIFWPLCCLFFDIQINNLTKGKSKLIII